MSTATGECDGLRWEGFYTGGYRRAARCKATQCVGVVTSQKLKRLAAGRISRDSRTKRERRATKLGENAWPWLQN